MIYPDLISISDGDSKNFLLDEKRGLIFFNCKIRKKKKKRNPNKLKNFKR